MKKDPRLNILGANVKAERSRKKLTQAQLAELAKIDDTTVSHIECAKQTPNIFIVLDIAKALNINITKLLEGIE